MGDILLLTSSPFWLRFAFCIGASLHNLSHLITEPLSDLLNSDVMVFHRIMPGFMAQGGCPLGDGTGGPGYEYAGEFDPDVRYTGGGLLSMANRGPGTDGSQFFITFGAATHLDGKHTIFGKVVIGMKTVRALEKRGIPGNRKGTPTERIAIDKATIVVE